VRIQVLLMIVLLSLFAVTAVAADISGKWTSEAPGRDGTPQVTTYTFKVSGATLTGTITNPRGDQEISEGNVSGDEISFVVVRTMGDMTMKTTYKGKVAGSEIHLTREMAMPPGGGPPGGGAPGGGGGGGRGAGGGGGGGRGPTEIVLKRAS
jgi:hypothetical protein